MRELNATEKKKSEVKMAYIVEVGSVDASNPHLLLLSGSFNFDFSFLILPNVIFNNTPVSFL